MTTRNIRLLLEYDGSRYVGWQWQDNGPSVQGALMQAIERLTGERPTLQVAGRTDAGVHALGQVASFLTKSRVPTARFAAALNSYLPADVSVHRSEEVPVEFNARHDARGKRYRYRVYQGRERVALEAGRAWHVRAELDLARMRDAASHLIGELDFESFRSAHCDAAHARRRMHAIDLEATPRPPDGRAIEITLYANAFCRHMCRIIAGTLVEVGCGRRTPESVRAARDARDRRQAGVTAPAGGLTLLEVLYG